MKAIWNFKQFSLTSKMFLSSIIPIVLFFILIVISYFFMNALRRNNQWVDHTYEVLNHAAKIEKLIVDLETGERGFLITGQEDFLEPFNAGKIKIASVLESTKQLVSDNPQQVTRLEQVHTLMNTWFEKASNLEINTRKQVKKNAKNASYLQKILAKGKGKKILDKIRAQLEILDAIFLKANNKEAQILVVKVAKDMVDQETGQRGFLITGKESFLEPYYLGKKTLVTHIEALNDVVDRAYDRGEMNKHIEKLSQLTSLWNNTIAIPGMKLREKVSNGKALHKDIELSISTGKGKKIFDNMRHILEQMNNAFLLARNQSGQLYILAITKNLVDHETGHRGYSLTGKKIFLEPYEQGKIDIQKNLTSLRNTVFNAYDVHKVRRMIATVNDLGKEWNEEAAIPEIAARVEMNKIKVTMEDVTKLVEAKVGKNIIDAIRKKLANFSHIEQALMDVRKTTLNKVMIISNWIILLGTFLAILFSLFFSYIIMRVIKQQFKYTTDVADNIAAGNFDTAIELQNEKDAMGLSFQKMAKALQNNARKLVFEKSKLEDQDWIKSTQSNLITKLQGVKNLPQFAEIVMHELIPTLGAHLGLFYYKKENNEQSSLYLIGSYAYKKRKNVSNEFALGEGLVGQCALENKPIFLTEAPNHYLEVTSGSGKSEPSNIMVLPILFEGDTIGVIEIASLKKFSDKEQALAELISVNIGVIMNNIVSQQHTVTLLQKSQELTEEMKAQQEELRTSNEELEEKTKILKESENELKSQSEELQSTNEELKEKGLYLEKQKKSIEEKNEALEISKKILDEKAEVLKKTSAYKSEFLANMSHELRTPLNSLLILSKSLADNDDGNLTEEQVEECTIIHNGGQELLILINDILDLSKVEAGKMQVSLVETSVENLAKDLQLQFKPVAEINKIAFHLDISKEFPNNLKLDEQKISQILKNLLSNAFKFTKNGSITLQIKKPDASQRFINETLTANNSIAFAVIDTGIGIPDDKQIDIFEAFQQADGSTSREFGGTGLGLTISRQLSHVMGGEIQLESIENKGTTFTLYLPIGNIPPQKNTVPSEDKCDTDKADDSKPDTNKFDDSKLDTNKFDENTPWIDDDRAIIQDDSNTLLIIEDDKNFATILLKEGRKHNFLCLATPLGSVGLRLASQYKPSAIVLDLGLPDMKGEDVLNKLKKHQDLQNIPVHIISAADKDHDFMNTGAIGFLQKPVKIEDLKQAFQHIEDILQKNIKHLLIVEDEQADQTAIQTFIKNNDINISTAGTGKDAREKILKGTTDCIILDLNLPDMSGFDLLKSLTEEGMELPPLVIYTDKELNDEEYSELRKFTSSIIIKCAESPERLLDEVSLFLHSVDSKLPKEQQKMTKTLHNSEHSLEGRHILVVDDDMRNLFALSKILKKRGLQIEIAKNGQFALDALAEKQDIELIIMDIMMPVMDGYTAIRKIREQKQFKELPIIALTAKAMPEDRQKCIDVGANDYLPKPVDVDQLLSLIRVWLGKS